MIWEDRPWDSQFFSFRIAAGFQEPGDDADSLRKFCRETPADCLYLFLHHPLSDGFQSVLQDWGAICADWKTTFIKSELQRQTVDESSISTPDTISEECYQLAVKSGCRSRFFVDEKFRPRQDALYREWVNTCVGRPDALVWEYRSGNEKLQGMMCASCHGTTGKLGLISTAPECQGQGIGFRLMQILENFYLDHACTTAEVVTQFQNHKACGLYRKCGYAISEIREVWHLWKR